MEENQSPRETNRDALPLLIGPDRKILRAGLHGEAVKSAVAEALGKTGRE